MAMMTYGILWMVLLVLFSCQNQQVTALHVQTHPENFNNLIDKELTITCVADGSFLIPENILTIRVEKKGQKPLAILQKHHVTLGPEARHNMEAEGRISDDTRPSYLRLRIRNPESEDAGTYRCVMEYLDESNELKQDVALTNVTINDQDMKAIVRNLLGKVSTLEETIRELGNEKSQLKGKLSPQHERGEELEGNVLKDNVNDDLKDQLLRQEKRLDTQERLIQLQKDQITQLETNLGVKEKQIQDNVKSVNDLDKKVHGLNQELKETASLTSRLDKNITQLASQLDNQETITQELESYIKEQLQNESYTTAFRASYDAKNKIVDGKTMVFGDLQFQVGEAYNHSTGIFTAPKTGIYVFNLALLFKPHQGWAILYLMVNDKEVATFLADEDDKFALGPYSSVERLQANDDVRLKIITKTGIHLEPNLSLSVFSGYLLKLT